MFSAFSGLIVFSVAPVPRIFLLSVISGGFGLLNICSGAYVLSKTRVENIS